MIVFSEGVPVALDMQGSNLATNKLSMPLSTRSSGAEGVAL